jgi:hypothetical protein
MLLSVITIVLMDVLTQINVSNACNYNAIRFSVGEAHAPAIITSIYERIL